MVSSLKLLGTDRLTLYVAARDFLRIFSDAANHIPRHRRTKQAISI
jgi:U3 small nucleolar RNA-associated protein 10